MTGSLKVFGTVDKMEIEELRVTVTPSRGKREDVPVGFLGIGTTIIVDGLPLAHVEGFVEEDAFEDTFHHYMVKAEQAVRDEIRRRRENAAAKRKE